MKNKVLKTTIVIMLIIVLTLADFALLGTNLITYALENINNLTSNENVKFAAYFKTTDEQTSQIEYEMTNSEMKLYLEIAVEDGVSFDGVITLEEGSNFKFKNKLNKGIAKIDENTITLDTIKKGNTAVIEVAIEPVSDENYGDSLLNKESVLTLTGQYANREDEVTIIQAEKKVTVSLIPPSDVDTALKAKVITNRIYEIGEENKRLVQIELNSNVIDNVYPVNNTTFEIALPQGVERIEAISKGTYATNGQDEKTLDENSNYTWDKENDLLLLYIKNTSEDEKISWKKDAIDDIVITLTLPEETVLGEEEYSIKSQIKLYGQEESLSQKELTYNLAKEADGLIRTTIENKEVIYKGKLYSHEEREYNSTTKIEVNYANLVESASILEKVVYRIEKDSEDKQASITYKTTILSKSEFDKVLGTEGTLAIKDQNGKLIKEIKTTDFDTTGNLEITHEAGVKELTIEITKPIQTGILRLHHTKTIKETEYTPNEIDEIKYLVEQSKVSYATAEYEFERIKSLGEIKSEVGINLESQSISADENNDMPIAITLKTDNEKYKLFESPTFILTMPEGVTVNSVSSGEESQLYGGLAISKLEVVNNKIVIKLSGNQTEYVKSNINSQINFTANLSVEKLMPNKVDTIKMQYENKGNTYELESEEVTVIASNARIFTHLEVENYNGRGTKLEKYSDSFTEVKGELPLDNEETIKVPVTYTIINNHNEDISVVGSILSYYTNKQGDVQELTNYIQDNITIQAKTMKVIEKEIQIPAGLYYSEKVYIHTAIDYEYLGTEYSVNNDIELLTETKEGIRDISIVDDKIQVETFAQLGDGTAVKEDDEVFDEQIIQYIIEVTNISNQNISNVKITNKQYNGKIYDLQEVEMINEVVSDDILIEHEYAELEDTEKTFTIKTLRAGESIELLAKVVVKKVEPDNTTTANISILADDLEEKQIQTISNVVKESNLKITTKNALTEEVEMYGKGQLYILTNIENLTDNQIQNIKGKMYLSEGLTFPENYELQVVNEEEGYLEIIQNVTYNEEANYIEFEITNIEPKQLITITADLYITSIPLEQSSRDEKVYCEINNIVSNSVEVNVKQMETQFSVKQTTNIEENQKVKDDETFVITAQITNIGYVDSAIYVQDSLPSGLEVVKIELIRDGETTDKTSEVQGQNLILFTQIEKQETITIKIKVKVNTTKIATDELTNKIIVIGVTGEATYSNEIIIEIDSNIDSKNDAEEPEIKPDEENTDPENKYPDNEGDDGNEGNESDVEPDDDNKQEEKTFTISGYAWVDKNQNDSKDGDETIKDVTVKIIDLNNQNMFVKDENGNEIEVKTDESGFYEIKGLVKGNYDLIFTYDTSSYELKENSSLKDYIIEDTKQKVAITNNINLNENKNIDLVLIELNEFNLKIEKYITKVIVQTANGTKTTKYSKQQLVREEIQKKYLEGAIVLVEYTMEVTNIGELAGYATEIIDYMPRDMDFYSELNTQWYEGEDGNLYNTTLATILINPGESKTVKLILSKSMTTENTGTTSNVVEISETMNGKEYSETELADNQSKAEIIINTATGTIITYVIAILNSAVIVAVGMYIIKKKVVGKG